MNNLGTGQPHYQFSTAVKQIVITLSACIHLLAGQAFCQFQPDLLSGPGSQYRPSTDGQYVVWEDGTVSYNKQDIYVYSLVSESGFFPDATQKRQEISHVDQGIAVWHDYRNQYTTKRDIFGYNIITGVPLTLCTEAEHQENPKIDYPIVVWQDERAGDADILGWDLSKGEDVVICTAAGNQFWPDIDGKWVVWQDYRHGNADIFAYDMVNEIELPVCTDANDQAFPRVHGNWVVWHDNRSGNYDIYAYDLVNHTEVLICDDPAGQFHPVISDDYIVWEDWRDQGVNGVDIYALDRSSGTEFDVIISGGDQLWPDLVGHFLVFESAGDIYSVELTDPPILTVTLPNGSEDIPAGGVQQIEWTSQGLEGNVEIEYTVDDGVNFLPIATVSILQESFEWDPVADVNSMDCRVRITSVELTDISDESDGNFWIFPCNSALTADFNRDCYVDVKDMAYVMAQWLDCGHPTDPTWCLE